MFWRLLWRLLNANRGRLAIALVAVASGAVVISALLNLELDITRKLTQEFRVLGANLVVSPRLNSPDGISNSPDTPAQAAQLMNSAPVFDVIEKTRTPDIAAAPFLYVIARAEEKPVVVAGTWLDQVRSLSPTWKVQGQWAASRDDQTKCLVGINAARQFQLVPGGQISLKYSGRGALLTVAGLIDSGGPEDNQIFVNLRVAQQLAGVSGQIELVQLSVSGSAANTGSYAAKLSAALPGYDVRPIRQVTEAEGQLLNRTRLLIASMSLLILVLTALCVLATMAALAMERRKDVGLMKALGGSISIIVGLFLAEVGVLGAMGGLIGCIAGVGLADWMGNRVFGTSITPRWEIFPLTIGMMIIVAQAGALPLRLLGKVRPAAILRGE